MGSDGPRACKEADDEIAEAPCEALDAEELFGSAFFQEDGVKTWLLRVVRATRDQDQMDHVEMSSPAGCLRKIPELAVRRSARDWCRRRPMRILQRLSVDVPGVSTGAGVLAAEPRFCT